MDHTHTSIHPSIHPKEREGGREEGGLFDFYSALSIEYHIPPLYVHDPVMSQLELSVVLYCMLMTPRQLSV